MNMLPSVSNVCFCLLILVWCSVFTPFWPVEPQKKEELQASNRWHVYFFVSIASLHILCFLKCALQLCHIHLENSLLQAGL